MAQAKRGLPDRAQKRLLIDAKCGGRATLHARSNRWRRIRFVQPAGGVVPSIDTVYRDLEHLDEMENAKLALIVTSHGLARLTVLESKHPRIHVDDTTVEKVFGQQEGCAARVQLTLPREK